MLKTCKFRINDRVRLLDGTRGWVHIIGPSKVWVRYDRPKGNSPGSWQHPDDVRRVSNSECGPYGAGDESR